MMLNSLQLGPKTKAAQKTKAKIKISSDICNDNVKIKLV